MRLILACTVIVSHCWPLLYTDNAFEPLGRLTGQRVTIGTLAVNCFFCISGFLIAASWTRSRTVVSYFLKRVLRIHPAFIAASAFCCTVVSPIAGVPLAAWFAAKRIRWTLINWLFLEAVYHQHAFLNNPHPMMIDGPMWTVEYEFRCYLLLPLLAMVGALRQRTRWIMALALVLDIIVHVASFRIDWLTSGWFFNPQTVDLAAFFLAGATFYVFRKQIRYRGITAIVTAFVFGLSMAEAQVFAIVAPVTLTYTLFWFAFHPRINLHRWAARGDFSYGTYLYAFPIQQLLVLWIGAARLNPLKLFLMSLPLALTAGVASWYLVERPFMSLKARKVQPIPDAALQQAVVGG